MSTTANDFSLHIATANGSGSQSANNILVRTLFRMGVPVGGKNLFPSNIQGLPTWFTIRAHPLGFVSRPALNDIVVSMNQESVVQDQKALKSGGLFIMNRELKLLPDMRRQDILIVEVPFREIVAPVSDSVKLRKLLANMIYVGILAEMLQFDPQVLESVVLDQFGKKGSILATNQAAIAAGRSWARENATALKHHCVVKVGAKVAGHDILIDGNSAAGMGLAFAGCTVAAWYPITPSTSLVESFERFANQVRRRENGEKTFAVVQAEDELSAICMVLGAGWAGARAATATSGPGLSLMAEAAGLAYFAEIPAVIWDVQRVGPSTGLPTRTMQGDVLAAAHLSHGDTKHVLLFPAHPEECFSFARVSLDLAEHLQTLVIVLSDLDLGMNFHMCKAFSFPNQPLARGQVLSKDQLDKLSSFARYRDTNGDGLLTRTLPGTEHPFAAYFTRGTGHDETGRYSEDAAVFKRTLERLARKWESAKNLVPAPELHLDPRSQSRSAGPGVGVIAFGSTDLIMPEVLFHLRTGTERWDYLRLRAYPFSHQVEEFLAHHEVVHIIEQNRDGQMAALLKQEYPKYAGRLKSVLEFNGLPLCAEQVVTSILSANMAPHRDSKPEVQA